MVRRVTRDERQAVGEGERAVVGVEVGEEVRHRDEHREARRPTRCAGTRCRTRFRSARSQPGPTPASSSPSTDLAMTSADALFESFAQSRSGGGRRDRRRCGSVRTPRRRARRRRSPRASSAHRSSVQPDTRSNRAWCQWHVTSPASTVPWCSGNPRCGHRSSIAYAVAVVSRTRRPGACPTFVSSRPVGFELGEGSGTDLGAWPCLSGRCFPQGLSCDNVLTRWIPSRRTSHGESWCEQAPDRRAVEARRRDGWRTRPSRST